MAKRIGIIAFRNVQALDIVGPADAFASALDEKSGGALYEVVLIGLSRHPVISGSGVLLQPQYTIHNAPHVDTLVIPGGAGLRTEPGVAATVAGWIRERSRKTRRIAAVCTGVWGIAPAGLLDHRTVTTHWRFAQAFASQFPKVRVQANALFVKDGAFYSSAGITAGIDLSLALIEEDFGPQRALEVARELVVYLKRPGGQEQFSAPLRFQSEARDRLSDVAAWITTHLSDDLSVESLAAQVNVSPRHFSRLFRRSFGTSPADFIEKLRLADARRLLGERGSRVDQVAAAVGFASADAFRRAFERRFGLSPSTYRGHFQTERSSSRRV